jgi:hypothetical protein
MIIRNLRLSLLSSQNTALDTNLIFKEILQNYLKNHAKPWFEIPKNSRKKFKKIFFGKLPR